MDRIRKITERLRKTVKYSAYDPVDFSEIWSFQSNAIRLYSLILILFVAIGWLSVVLFSSSFSGDVSIARNKLEDQEVRISELTGKLEAQEAYIENIRLVLSGKVPLEVSEDTLLIADDINIDSLKDAPTTEERKLSNKVKSDLMTPAKSEVSSITYLASPVRGVISQEFDALKHHGIDVVTEKNTPVKACLGGTVLYAGYTRKDGYVLILEHVDGFTSVYKHNKTLLKKAGVKVQLGDPIAIVGNTGENTDGPHLHFELWYNQTPVNPTDYITFTR